MVLAVSMAPGTSQQTLACLEGALLVALPGMDLPSIASCIWALAMMDAMAPEMWNLMMAWYLHKQASQVPGLSHDHE